MRDEGTRTRYDVAAVSDLVVANYGARSWLPPCAQVWTSTDDRWPWGSRSVVPQNGVGSLRACGLTLVAGCIGTREHQVAPSIPEGFTPRVRQRRRRAQVDLTSGHPRQCWSSASA